MPLGRAQPGDWPSLVLTQLSLCSHSGCLVLVLPSLSLLSDLGPSSAELNLCIAR